MLKTIYYIQEIYLHNENKNSLDIKNQTIGPIGFSSYSKGLKQNPYHLKFPKTYEKDFIIFCSA